jgi:hypothetical protein
LVKRINCAADGSALLLPASLFGASGVPGASTVGRGRARATGHRIGARRTKKRALGDAARNIFLSGASQIVLGDALWDTTGDALSFQH